MRFLEFGRVEMEVGKYIGEMEIYCGGGDFLGRWRFIGKVEVCRGDGGGAAGRQGRMHECVAP